MNVYYRPLLEIFYRLEYRLWGFHAAGFHLVNLLIHMANGLLLLALLRRLQFNQWLAFGVSLIFLIHPVQSEAVACVAGISNLLMATFVLLTIYFYVREKYVLSLFILMGALLTKEQVVMTPLLLILVDWYRKTLSFQHVLSGNLEVARTRSPINTFGDDRWRLWLIFAIATLVFLWLRSTISGAHLLEDILQFPGELRLRLLAIPRTLLMYLRLVVAPYDLHYYRNTDILQPNVWGFIGLGLLIIGLIWFVKFKNLSDKRAIIFGGAWFVLTLLPVLNVVPLINEYSFILTAEHFLYLPMVGVVVVIMTVIPACFKRESRTSGPPTCLPAGRLIAFGGDKILFLVVCIILGSLTIHQNTFWRGELPLFERMAKFEPYFGRGQLLLARAYFSNGQKDLALVHYRQALAIMQEYERKAANDKSRRFYQGLMKTMSFELNQIH